MQESVFVNRGFQLLNTFHFNHQIKCVSQQSSDSVAVFYNIGSENVTNVCPYKQNEHQHKFTLEEGLTGLIYNKKYRLFVTSCPDLAMRIFNEHFELLDTVHVTATVLSLAFNETTSELYTGGVGCISTWKLRHQLHNPLVPSKPFTSSIQSDQWVIALHFNTVSEKLVAVCQDAVYIIDTKTRKQIYRFTNTHRSSLTCAVLFDSMEYLITGAKDGSIKVWNCILHYEVHNFTGHMKAVTGLTAHPSAPCVISCSMDGTIRTWHLENMTECCRVDCGDGILGMCSDFPQGNKLSSYSHHEIRMWTVDQLETHFTTVNSHVLSMFRVANTNGPPARIIALAEDDGLRLLSPVSGQIITILFPMFSSQMLHDVVYSLSEDLIFALLKSNDVLVFSASTNPCSAQQLWVPNKRAKIHCIAMCTVVLKDGISQSVVFAGQQSGDIALLHSQHSTLTMALPCPAHDGHVIKLVGSCDPIRLSADSDVHYALLSFGTDHMLNVWAIEMDSSAQLTLKLQLSINIEPGPTFMCLLDSTICMALNNCVTMLKLSLSVGQDSRQVPLSFTDLPLLTHQREDDHSDVIVSLQSSDKLKLFATSSRDGHVKIWSEDNKLVSELEFGDTLAAVCFANDRGDLLIGFQKHVCVVKAEDYLTSNYVEITRDLPHDEVEERALTFDPELEFWYDSTRVPSLPAEQATRQQPLTSHTPTRHQTTLLSSHLEAISEHSSTDTSMSGSADLLQTLVDRDMAQSNSQHYLETLKQDGHKLEVLPETTLTTTTVPSPSPPTGSAHSLNTAPSPCASLSSGFHSLSNQSLSRSNLSLALSSIPSDVSTPLAQVSPLESPSVKLPIAPDCLIPNSVIRAKIGYVPPVVTLPSAYKPPKLRHRVTIASSDQSLNSQDSSRTYYTEEDAASDVSLELAEENSSEVVTCVSGFVASEERSKQVKKSLVKDRRKSRRYSQKIKTVQLPNKKGSLQNDKILSEKLSETSGTISRLSYGSDTDRGFSGYSLRSRSTSSNYLSRQLSTVTIEATFSSQGQRSSLTSRDTSSSLRNGRDSSSSQRGSVTSILLPAPTPPAKFEESHMRSSKRRRSSLGRSSKTQERVSSSHTPTEHGRRYSRGGAPGLPVLNELDSLQLLIQRICAMAWFPKNALKARGILCVDEVYPVLIELVKLSHMSVFSEVCKSLLEIKKLGALSGEQEVTFALRLIDRQRDTEKTVSTHSLRLEILKTLKQLGLGNKEVLYAILPLLTDSNVEIRKAAFRVLRSITGIVRKDQLHQLLVDMELLQHIVIDEDEVIGELAERVRNGRVNPPSNIGFATMRKIKTNLRPVKSRSNQFSVIQHNTSLPTDTDAIRPPGLQASYQPRYSLHPLDADSNQYTSHKRRGTHFETFNVDHQISDNYNHNYDNVAGTRASNVGRQRVPRGLSRTFPGAVQKLMVSNSTTFSQTQLAMQLMLNSYGRLDHRMNGDGLDLLEYKWSEVYPVIKELPEKRKTCQNSQSITQVTRPTQDLGPITDTHVHVQGKSLEPIQGTSCNSVANSVTRKLFQRFNHSNVNKSSSRLKTVVRGSREQCLVIKLPKLTCI